MAATRWSPDWHFGILASPTTQDAQEPTTNRHTQTINCAEDKKQEEPKRNKAVVWRLEADMGRVAANQKA